MSYSLKIFRNVNTRLYGIAIVKTVFTWYKTATDNSSKNTKRKSN